MHACMHVPVDGINEQVKSDDLEENITIEQVTKRRRRSVKQRNPQHISYLPLPFNFGT